MTKEKADFPAEGMDRPFPPGDTHGSRAKERRGFNRTILAAVLTFFFFLTLPDEQP